MIEINKISELIDGFFVETDIFAVDIKVSDKNDIEIFLDSDTFVTIDTCVALSRFIENYFDRNEEDYQLTVSSAGATAPFLVLRQYKKNIGKDVVVTLNDNKEIKGILKDVSDDGIIITKQTLSNVKKGMKPKIKAEEDISIKFNEIKTTKLFFDFK